jgi:hypothetical protein
MNFIRFILLRLLRKLRFDLLWSIISIEVDFTIPEPCLVVVFSIGFFVFTILLRNSKTYNKSNTGKENSESPDEKIDFSRVSIRLVKEKRK